MDGDAPKAGDGVTPLAPTEAMKRVADGFLRSQLARQLGADTVFIWWSRERRVRVAFVGPALRLQRRIREVFPNRRHALDLDLQRSVGLPGVLLSAGYADMQTMDEPDPYLDSVLDGAGTIVTEALGGDSVVEHVEVTLMPEEGEPWSPRNDPTPYYDAKAKKTLVGHKPAWVIEVALDPELQSGDALLSQSVKVGPRAAYGADMCVTTALVEACAREIVGMFPDRDHFTFLATHSVPLGRRGHMQDVKASGKTIRECGGMLYPSIALGQVPATIYGPLVLCASVATVLGGMRPYRSRGVWPVVAYSSDAWTVTTQTVVTRGSVEMFGELTGNRSMGFGDQFWVLGAPVEWHEEQVQIVGSTKVLASKMLGRARRWRRGMSEADLQRARDYKGEAFPYLEAKVNGRVSMSCFPLAVMPKILRVPSMTFLRAAGFTGDVLQLDVSPQMVQAVDEGRPEIVWEYAWRVREAVLAYAAERPGTAILAVEEA